jgi:hypothetical protein
MRRQETLCSANQALAANGFAVAEAQQRWVSEVQRR